MYVSMQTQHLGACIVSMQTQHLGACILSHSPVQKEILRLTHKDAFRTVYPWDCSLTSRSFSPWDIALFVLCACTGVSDFTWRTYWHCVWECRSFVTDRRKSNGVYPKFYNYDKLHNASNPNPQTTTKCNNDWEINLRRSIAWHNHPKVFQGTEKLILCPTPLFLVVESWDRQSGHPGSSPRQIQHLTSPQIELLLARDTCSCKNVAQGVRGKEEKTVCIFSD